MSDAQTFDYLRPIVNGWLGKLALGLRSRKPFQQVSDQCNAFFSGAVGFMWQPEYSAKYLGGRHNPKFRITISKAFELLAIFGPMLYWNNPQRQCRPRKLMQVPPQVLQSLNDPFAMQLFQQTMQQQNGEQTSDALRAQMLETWLNYTPDMQPGGGLAGHSWLAITEALVKGRGCLWSQPYHLPATGGVCTGAFWDSVDNLLIDPDAHTLEDAKWISRRHIKPHWEVERIFKLPKDSLKGKGHLQSAYVQGETAGEDLRFLRREEGKTFDLVIYYEVFSKAGVGMRLSGMESHLKESFDELIGDYAYIVVSPDVEFPLNAYTDTVTNATDAEIKQMFAWPSPFWVDGEWPLTVLDFYPQPNSPWPIAPMSPGLGELMFLNVMMAHLANRIWSSSRDFVAVLESAYADVEAKLKTGEDLTILKVKEVHQDISKVVSFLQHPPTNLDAWKIVEAISESFDRRVGLSDMLYGMASTQSRSSEDAQAKNQNVNIRPQWMQNKVEEWQRKVSHKERLVTRWYVEPSDVQPLLGPLGSYLWQKLITDEDPGRVISEMDVTIEAGSVRRPDKNRDAQNMSQVLPVLFPALMQYAEATADTNPLNQLMQIWGGAIDQDLSAMRMGPFQKQPDPQVVQEQKMQMEAQRQKTQDQAKLAEAKTQTELAKAAILAHTNRQEITHDAATRQQEFQHAAVEHQQTLQQAEQQHQMDLVQQAQKHQQQMAMQQALNQAKIQAQRAMATNGASK